MHIWFQICASIVSSCQLGRRHVYFHSCAPILASSIVSFWCTADLVCVKCIRLSQVGDFQLCSLRPRRRRRRRSVHGDRLLHGRIDATARYGYLELAIEQMTETADASNALDHGLHYLRSTGNACAARALLWWGWDNSDAHAGMATSVELSLFLPPSANFLGSCLLRQLHVLTADVAATHRLLCSSFGEHPLLEPPWRSATGRHGSSSPSDASRLFDEMCEKKNRDINDVFMCLIQIYFLKHSRIAFSTGTKDL